MRLKAMQLSLHTHYEPIRFWLAMFMSFAIAVALITFGQRLLKLNETINNNSNKNSQYLECIAKIFIAPPKTEKSIEGNIEDPVQALRRCKIAAGIPSTPVAQSTSVVATQPSPAPKVSQNPPQNSGMGQGAQNPPSTSPPPPQTPPPPQSILPGVGEPIVGCLNTGLLGVCL